MALLKSNFVLELKIKPWQKAAFNLHSIDEFSQRYFAQKTTKNLIGRALKDENSFHRSSDAISERIEVFYCCKQSLNQL